MVKLGYMDEEGKFLEQIKTVRKMILGLINYLKIITDHHSQKNLWIHNPIPFPIKPPIG